MFESRRDGKGFRDTLCIVLELKFVDWKNDGEKSFDAHLDGWIEHAKIDRFQNAVAWRTHVRYSSKCL